MSGGGEARVLGQWGEALVAEDLRQKGWTIAATNFRCRMGELDIVARNGRYLVFVEVKLRKNAAFGTAGAFVDRRKQEKLRASAMLYLSRRPTDLQPRFDVVEVYAPRGTGTENPEIFHLENAF